MAWLDKFMEFIAEKNFQENFALSITFWICLLIPSSHKDLLSIYYAVRYTSEQASMVTALVELTLQLGSG